MIKGFSLAMIAMALSGCVAVDEVKPEYCGPTPVSHKAGLHTVLVESNPPSMVWEDITDPVKKEQFLAAFNASPPKSEIEADSSVRIYHRYDSLNLLVVIANKKGCVIAGQELARPLVLLWLQGKIVMPNKHKKKSKPKKFGA